MSFTKYLLPLLVLASINHVLAEVRVLYGQVSVKGYKECEISHNGEVLKYTGPGKVIFPGLRFGLISYICDNHVGHLISPFECKRCGLFCSYNEYILSCQQEDAPFWLGIIVGLVLACVVGGLLFFCLYKVLDTKGSLIFGNGTTKKTIPTSVNTEDEALKDDCINGVLYKSGFQPHNKENNSYNLPKGFCKQLGGKPSTPSNKTGLKFLIAGILLNKSVNACDLTFLLGANQTWRVCGSTLCQDTSKYTFPLTLGQEICFKDDFGEMVSLNVSEIKVKTRYRIEYYTSDYHVTNLTTLSNSKCQGYSELCYDNDRDRKSYNCHGDAIATLNKEMRDSENKAPQGWFCNVIKSKNYHYVFSCCRYFLRAERIGALYPVYSRVSDSWGAKVTVRQENALREIQLSAYDPATVLSELKLHTVDSIPLTLESFSAVPPQLPNSLFGYKDGIFFVNSSTANEPKPHSIGDYQVHLNKTRDAFFMHEGITCKQKDPASLSDCSCACDVPESSVQQFQKNLANFKQPDKFLIRGEHFVIDTFEEVKDGKFYVKLGAWSAEDSPIKTAAKCDIDVVMTYGCRGCNEKPYMVIKPRNVEVEGLVPFNSNCSFEKPYLQCDLEPVKLVLKDAYDTCSIHVPSLNKTMVIQVQYSYLGHQVGPSGNINLEETVYEVLGHIMASEHFTRAFNVTLLLCLISGLVLLFVYHKIRTKHKSYEDRMRVTPVVRFFNR